MLLLPDVGLERDDGALDLFRYRLSSVFLRDAFRKVDGSGGTDDAAAVGFFVDIETFHSLL